MHEKLPKHMFERWQRLPEWAKGSHRLCRACGLLFWTQPAFDMHQTEHYRRKGKNEVDCHDPQERGLVWSEDLRAWSVPRTSPQPG